MLWFRVRVRLVGLVRSSGVYDVVEPAHSAVRCSLWRRAGRPVPPPSAVKRAILRDYGRSRDLRTLVETGTYKADTVRALRKDFDRIYSIEIDEGLYRRAVRRCRSQPNANLRYGDSSVVLPAVLAELDGPALLWLDAHYSGSGTGSGALETPVLSELRSILDRPGPRHTVLIDDHREFLQRQVDYPSEQTVHDLARHAGYDVSVQDDILRLVPSGEAGRG